MGKIFSFLLLTLVVVACNADGGGSYKIEGRLLNLNQGEFYIYSPDGVMQGIDTLSVLAGRFNYKGSCSRSGTLVIVFPNFSEQPIFVSPGKSIKVRGDVSHLKELRVSGTRDNNLMDAFRDGTKDATSEELLSAVKEFVAAHPESIVSLYLINKYFIRTATPDYKTAGELLEQCLSAQPDNGLLAQEVKKIVARGNMAVGALLPSFSAATVSGDTITDQWLRCDTAIVYLWASYDYDSYNIQRILRDNSKEGTHLLGLCVDGSVRDCRRALDRDRIAFPVVCDGQLFDSPLVQLFGMSTLPDNIVIENGVITARGLTSQELRDLFSSAKK